MTIEDYQRNLRGVNDGGNFTPEYLVRSLGEDVTICLAYIFLQTNIYESIRQSEIVMPEEHTGQLGFEYAWKKLLARSTANGALNLYLDLV